MRHERAAHGAGSRRFHVWVTAVALFVIVSASVSAQEKKPNIVVIFGDDIGMWNVGAYTHGMMGKTSIDAESMDCRQHFHRNTKNGKSCETVSLWSFDQPYASQ